MNNPYLDDNPYDDNPYMDDGEEFDLSALGETQTISAKNAKAGYETGAALATGMLAFPISKGAKWLKYGTSGGDLDQARAEEQRINEEIQYQPTSKEAREAVEAIGEYVFDPIFGTLNKAGRYVAGPTLAGMGLLPPSKIDSPDVAELVVI